MNRIKRPFEISVFLMLMFLGMNLQAELTPRNVIIISVDTLRADHLGCYGYPVNTSPAIDAFAKDGVLFSRCYTLTPLTAPAFSTMLTSLPPHKHGAKRNGLAVYKKVKTLPQILKRYGYRSAAVISNWPIRKKLAGLGGGFDVYYEVFTNKRYWGITNPEGQAPQVNKKAIGWLEANHKKRFFLWVQYTDPHAPYTMHKKHKFDYKSVKPSVYPPGSHIKKIKKYDSEIAFTDYHIGKLLDKIKELDLYEVALIIFHADHGESFGEHDYLKHGKKLYNSTLHVPLVVKLPGRLLKNTVRHENASLLDIGPTIFAGLNIMRHPQMEGLDLFERRNDFSKRRILLETYGGMVVFKRKSKKYHLKVKPIRYGILEGSTKVIYNVKNKTFETYHLGKDPFETRSVFVAGQLEYRGLKDYLRGRSAGIEEYIKLNRMHRIQPAALSTEDFEKLKSLGYFE